MVNWGKHLAAVSALLLVFFLLSRPQIFTWPYYYDEADYMYAVSLGLRANYTDSPAQSLTDYIERGLAGGNDPAQRGALSAKIRASNDVNFYRHWHGPVYYYWLMALAPAHLDEYATRAMAWVFPVLTGLAIYLGSLWLFPADEGFLAAILSSAFYLWSYATILSNEIAPHPLFVLWYVAALLLLMKWRDTEAPRYWYGAVAAAAVAFCTLEVAFVLILVMIVCVAMKWKLTGWRFLGKSVLLFFGTVLALWPAGVLKLTFAKAYLFMAYLAVYRKSPWGDVTFAETWRLRFEHSPWEWLLLAAAVVLYAFVCASGVRRRLFPIALYAGLMLLALLRVNTDTPRYMLPFLPALHIFAGFTFASVLMSWKPAVRAASGIAICALLLWNTASQIRHHPILPAPRAAAVLASLRERNLTGKSLLVPQSDLPMIHYYFPHISIQGYVDVDERRMLLVSQHFDAVLYPGDPVRVQE
jgi:hypothetical protein